ncbi:hypothetical protein ACS15_4666 [Ralstonia insidiosa]|uniref:Uncharacterized protein n=1 Tax=Ralstonia insidiosa TaxID=190721 RepID=A0AAC9BKY2_9RALS|nr:hypothetical protein ACS15_4666 [Ralstonia insidiosa]
MDIPGDGTGLARFDNQVPHQQNVESTSPIWPTGMDPIWT